MLRPISSVLAKEFRLQGATDGGAAGAAPHLPALEVLQRLIAPKGQVPGLFSAWLVRNQQGPILRLARAAGYRRVRESGGIHRGRRAKLGPGKRPQTASPPLWMWRISREPVPESHHRGTYLCLHVRLVREPDHLVLLHNQILWLAAEGYHGITNTPSWIQLPGRPFKSELTTAPQSGSTSGSGLGLLHRALLGARTTRWLAHRHLRRQVVLTQQKQYAALTLGW